MTGDDQFRWLGFSMETSFSIEKPNHLFSLNHCSDCLLFSLYFGQMKNREMSAVNNFAFEVKPSDKSLI